ncbi:MAG TPA: hypothetical protein VFJ07_20345 [Streptosporangiaceae bacterium]|nr:hypothetical protein [Streptosporangiaceae bacterium]
MADGTALPRPRGARAHLAAAALRRHWLAAVLLAAGLALRVLAQVAYRPVLFYIDTTRYLYNDAPGMDPVGYKGPLRAILAVANFNTVAATAHLLGLAMAVLLYVLLLRRGCPRWLAALAMAPLLLDAYQVQIEQTLMPDTWFEALIVAGLAILLWRPAPGWRTAAAGGLVLGTSAIFAQVGEVLLLPAVIYLLAAGGGWRRALGRAATLCVAFAVPILAYSTVNYLAAGSFFLSHTGVTSAYGRMAAAADCATLRLPQAERAMCPTRYQQALGPDFLEFGLRSPIRPYYDGLARDNTDSLITDFNHRVLSQQPLRVLHAYLRDVVRPFALTRDGSPGVTAISRWQFQRSYPYFPPHASRQVIDSSVGRFGGGRPAVWAPGATFLRGYQLHGGYTPGPLFALCVLAGLIGSASLLMRGRAGRAVREPALACLLMFASGVAVLLASDVFEFSWRYLLPALVTLVPAGALGIGIMIRATQARRIAG